ncbi:MAG TPA: glycosyltransferase family 2 protein [Thermomonospora sp.]|nr:glycosyltransferase family 2 protein [Thermomonospora sp.]
MSIRLWVVVPAYNEAPTIGATLEALAGQHRAPDGVVVVDNASTDGTAEVVRAFAAAHPGLNLVVVHEPQKGTGAAADTGMRHAIACGATHLARTDADCVPPPHWTAAILRGFASGLDMVAGRLRPRTDEFPLTWKEKYVMRGLQEVATALLWLRPGDRRRPAFFGPFVMSPGSTLAITAELYRRSGGFPRAPIEVVHDDHELAKRVRRVGGTSGRPRDVWVYWSMRRVRAYGVCAVLLWYAQHRSRPPVVDVRLPAEPGH